MTDETTRNPAYVCDISSFGLLRIAGSGATRFVSAMFTGDMDAARELFGLTQGLLLNSDGEIIDAVLVLHTGDEEYLMISSPENSDEVFQWLCAHAAIEDDAGRVFGEARVEDAAGRLAVLLMYGPGVRVVHDDLIAACEGRFAFMEHEFREQGVYGVPMLPAYLLMVPANVAAQVGDFVTGWPQVEVLSVEECRRQALEAGTYRPSLEQAAYVKPAAAGLRHLLRESGGFVGQRNALS